MQYLYPNGITSVVLRLKIRDATSILDAGLTGLTSASAGLIISTICDNEAAATVYTQAGATIEAVTTLGTYAAPTATKCRIKLVDNTNHPGLYELQLADARFAVANARQLHITITGPAALNIVQEDYKVQLAPAPADVKLLLGTAWLTPGTAGTPDVNAKLIGGTAQTGRDLGASVLLSAGSGTGQLDFTSGVVKANLAQILGTALTETAGQLAGGFKKFFNIGSPAATMDHGVLMDTATAVTNDVGITQAGADKAWGTASRTLTAFSFSVALSGAAVQAIWDALTSALTTAGSIGKRLADFITGDAFVRLGAPAGASVSADIASVKTSVGAVTGTVGSVTGNVGGNVVGSVGSVTADVGITQAGADKVWGTTVRTLSAAGVQAIWDALTSALTTAGSIGKKLADWVIGTTQTGDSFARLGAPAGASVSADIAAVKADTAAGATASALATAQTAITAIKGKTDQFIFTITNKVDASIQAAGDFAQGAADKVWASATRTLTAFAFAVDISAAGVQAVWDALTSALTTAGSIGKKLADWVIAPAAPTVAQIWDEPIAGHLTAGTTGAKLNAASTGGDPWATALPGSYGAGTAGKIVGDNINATVSSRALEAGGNVAAIKAKTDNLPADPADASDVAAAVAAIQADTDNIQTRLPAALTGAGNMKADMLAIDGNATSASRLRRSSSLIHDGAVTGAATLTTLIDSGLTHPDADQLKGRIVIFDGNVTAGLREQATDIVSFDPTTDKLTFTLLTSAPAAGDLYVIV